MSVYAESALLASRLGISVADANILRRAQLTLHRWAELECGDGNAYASWCIVRGRKWGGSFDGPAPSDQAKKNGQGFVYDDNGEPFIERHLHSENFARYEPIADREKGALRRIGEVCSRLGLHYYHQTDPRGCALYVSREPLTDSDYNRGVAMVSQ